MNAEQLAASVVRLEGVVDDIAEIKESMKVMAAAVTRLAVIEERQTNDRTEIGRLFKRSDNHEQRIGVLEQAAPMQKQTREWVSSAVTAVVTAVVTALVSLVLLQPKLPLSQIETPRATVPAK